ncbi:hypothetical protein JJD41_23490 [Oxynema sp. CENA135]|uniref:hypothetical protein n=1 Tax=Oxynema sp. CENA135 TaxID=984206 RepID=UPI00190A07BB|nr:hypothetical protein [Oxynema sp. CENA135]MBK4732807.1 hypothetical protein [Oxynema sp. CENA135]
MSTMTSQKFTLNKDKLYQLLDCLIPNVLGLGNAYLGFGLSLLLLLLSWQQERGDGRRQCPVLLSLMVFGLLVVVHPRLEGTAMGVAHPQVTAPAALPTATGGDKKVR